MDISIKIDDGCLGLGSGRNKRGERGGGEISIKIDVEFLGLGSGRNKRGGGDLIIK